MGYLHINNLYKEQLILLFRECYALEKIHGTSAHLTYHPPSDPTSLGRIDYFSGGESHARFVALFDEEALLRGFKDLGTPVDKTVTVYGEAYGGSQQGMSETYGKELKFIAFDVQIGDCWLNVPDAVEIVEKKLGLEFVHFRKISTDLADLDAERDFPSVQAIRNGVSFINNPLRRDAGGIDNPKPREGVVLRPLVELTLNNGNRLIVKHKGDAFKETATPRQVVDPAKMAVLEDANSVANEWVTATRLEHVLDKLPGHCMEKMRDIIAAMQEDVLREGKGEIVESEAVKKSIGKKTVDMYKNYLKAKMVKA